MRTRNVARVRQQRHVRVATLGTDMGYDSGDFLVELKRRKIVEEFFGWGKTISTMRRSKHIERFKIRQQAQPTAATYNLVRMCRLLAA